MTTKELSILTFMVRAIVASPSIQSFESIQRELPKETSEGFMAALNVIGGLVKQLSPSATITARHSIIRRAVKKLKEEDSEIAKSVGEALDWALASASVRAAQY